MRHSLLPILLLNINQQILKVSYLIIIQLILRFAIFELQVLIIQNSLSFVIIKHIINHLKDLISLKDLFQL